MESGKDNVEVEIMHSHSNISLIKKNGKIIFENKMQNSKNTTLDAKFLKFNDIYNFATTFKIEDLKELLTVDKSLWNDEVKEIEKFYDKFESTLPTELLAELNTLKENLK